MQPYIEFAFRHPFLIGAAVLILGILIATEVLRLIRNVSFLAPAAALRVINDQDAAVVDVRNVGEYREGHVPNARNLPLKEIQERPSALDRFKGHPVLVCGRTNGQAATACAAMRKNGLEPVYALSGGIESWREANLPVQKGK